MTTCTCALTRALYLLLRPVHAAALLRQVLPAREARSADDMPSNWLGSDGLSDALWRRHRR